MSAAFLCGNFSAGLTHFITICDIGKIVKEYIKNEKIDKIYLTNRNQFDSMVYESIAFRRIENIEFVLLRDKRNSDIDYIKNIQSTGVVLKSYCPFDKRIDNDKLYETIYNYAIENSEYMITYLKYDDDISKHIAERAEKKNIKILNIADDFEKMLIYNTAKEIIRRGGVFIE